MCITAKNPAFVKNGQLKLWKVIRKDNCIGIWSETYNNGNYGKSSGVFVIGINISHQFINHSSNRLGQFHCFFTRKDARKYNNYRMTGRGLSSPTKIIKVYADSKDVVLVGVDEHISIPAISVSKMEIKSLNHQR